VRRWTSLAVCAIGAALFLVSVADLLDTACRRASCSRGVEVVPVAVLAVCALALLGAAVAWPRRARVWLGTGLAIAAAASLFLAYAAWWTETYGMSINCIVKSSTGGFFGCAPDPPLHPYRWGAVGAALALGFALVVLPPILARVRRRGAMSPAGT
jgi:hypothetical protein